MFHKRPVKRKLVLCIVYSDILVMKLILVIVIVSFQANNFIKVD